MKTLQILATLAVLWVIAGCNDPAPPSGVDPGRMNRWIVRSFRDDSMKNAIIAQHRLHPYHFVTNGAELNGLGDHDLKILAERFKDHPGKLNVRRGDLTAKLYKARVATVRAALQRDGVDVDKVAIVDGLPGGDGMESERVLQIRAAEQEGKSGGTTYQSGTATVSPGTTGGGL